MFEIIVFTLNFIDSNSYLVVNRLKNLMMILLLLLQWCYCCYFLTLKYAWSSYVQWQMLLLLQKLCYFWEIYITALYYLSSIHILC